MRSPFFWPNRTWLWLGFVLLLLVLSGCAEHVLYHQQGTSRDYTYIEFARNSSPYIFRGQVGGEHMTFVKVLGFQGERYTVAMRQDGDADFSVYGEGVRVLRKGATAEVEIIAIDALFEIEISALSYGDYELVVVKK